MPTQISYELRHVEIDEQTATLYLELLEDPLKPEEPRVVVTPEGSSEQVNEFMKVWQQFGPALEDMMKGAFGKQGKKMKWDLHGITVPRKTYEELGRPLPGTIIHLGFTAEEKGSSLK